MKEKISIEFTDSGKTAYIELDDSQSPKTVKAILDNLGIELPMLVKTNFIDCYEDSRLGWDFDTEPLNTKSQIDKTQACNAKVLGTNSIIVPSGK